VVVELHKSFGFVEEGYLKKHILKCGKFVDVVFLSMFASAYFKTKEKIQKRAGLL